MSLAGCKYVSQPIGGSPINPSTGGEDGSSSEREKPSDYSDSFSDIESESDDRNTSKPSNPIGGEDSGEIDLSNVDSLIESISVFYIEPSQITSSEYSVTPNVIHALDVDGNETDYTFEVCGLANHDGALVLSNDGYIKSTTPLILEDGTRLKSVIAYTTNWPVAGLSPLKYHSGNSSDSCTNELMSIAASYDENVIVPVIDDITEDYLSIELDLDNIAIANAQGYQDEVGFSEFIFAFQEE